MRFMKKHFKKMNSTRYLTVFRIQDHYHEESTIEKPCEARPSIEDHSVYEGLQNNLKVGIDDSRVKDALDSISKDDSLSSTKFVLQQEDFQQLDVKFDDHNTLDAFGINLDVSYNDDYNTEAIPSLFEDQIAIHNFQKTSSLSLEFYQVAPFFYEYDDDLENKDPDMCDVEQSNQQFH